MAVLLIAMSLPATAFGVDKSVTVDANGAGDYTDIQSAIDYIAAQEDSANWTIYIKNGIYDRFSVPHWSSSGISDLSIIGESRDGVTVNVLDQERKTSSLIDHGGINIFGSNVTLKTMTIKAGSISQYWDDAAISTSNGTIGSSGVSLSVSDCNLIGPGVYKGATYGIFWACPQVNVTNCNISGFTNAIELMIDNFNIPSGQTCLIEDNVISGSKLPIHGYMFGADGGGELKINDNIITGSEELTSVSFLTYPSSGTTVSAEGNTFTYAAFGFQNAPEGITATSLFTCNTFVNSYVTDETFDFATRADYSVSYSVPEGIVPTWSINRSEAGNYAELFADALSGHEHDNPLTLTTKDGQGAGTCMGLAYNAINVINTEIVPDDSPLLEKWIISDNAKQADGALAGSVKTDDVGAGDVVDFALISNVPSDLSNYIAPVGNDSYPVVFHDCMADSLTLETGSVKVSIDGKAVDSSLVDVSLENMSDGCTFEISFDLAELYQFGYFTANDLGNASVTVTYSAKVSEGIKAGRYVNTASLSYPSGKTPDSSVSIMTYGINLFKYDQTNNTGLGGAVFELYNASLEDGSYNKGTLIATMDTAEDGTAVLDGLDSGQYILIESKAPKGYTKAADELLLSIPDDADKSTGIVSISVANTLVPVTDGGSSPVIYTVIAVAAVMAAGFIFVIYKSLAKQS